MEQTSCFPTWYSMARAYFFCACWGDDLVSMTAYMFLQFLEAVASISPLEISSTVGCLVATVGWDQGRDYVRSGLDLVPVLAMHESDLAWRILWLISKPSTFKFKMGRKRLVGDRSTPSDFHFSDGCLIRKPYVRLCSISPIVCHSSKRVKDGYRTVHVLYVWKQQRDVKYFKIIRFGCVTLLEQVHHPCLSAFWTIDDVALANSKA